MCEVNKTDIKKMLEGIDVSNYSHLLICVNRLNGCCSLKLVDFCEKLGDAVKDIEEEGVYKVISICDICKDMCVNLDEYGVISEENVKTSTSEKALEFAKEMHNGQYRCDGTDYIVHPIRVANYVSELKESNNIETLLASAYLHDTLEDTDATYYDLVGKFGSQVASIVLELTTDEDLKKVLGKTKYLEIKMKNMTSWALVIKLCDRLDNVSDLKDMDDFFRNKYAKETAEILDYLVDNRSLSKTHLCIIKKIIEKLNMCKVDSTEVVDKINLVNDKVKALV
jgi:(p)ppGpp synthase/HD superfamily hydrolase